MARFAAALLFVVTIASAGCGAPQQPGDLHRPSDEGFPEVRGGRYRLPRPGECRATVLLFVARECPVSNAYSPEINRLCADFTPRGVSFCLVYTEPDLDGPTAARHAADYGYSCPAVLDPDLKLADRTGVTVTPEAAVLGANGRVAYRGRIDDRFPSLGKRRDQPTRCDLRGALEDILAGRPVAVPQTAAVGCYIERRRAN